jgi:hypothetical protein
MIGELENQHRLPAPGLSGTPANRLAFNRGSGLASLGGPAHSGAGSAAVLNGTGIRRKP